MSMTPLLSRCLKPGLPNLQARIQARLQQRFKHRQSSEAPEKRSTKLAEICRRISQRYQNCQCPD